MDIKVIDGNSKFKFRVCGILINDNKVLTVKMCNNNFYCLPGGHLHLNEDSLTGMKREYEEETGILATPQKLIAINESFFTRQNGGKTHELSLYYIMEAENLGDKAKDFELVENDEGIIKPLQFKWININELDKLDFRPKFIANKLMASNMHLEHIISHE